MFQHFFPKERGESGAVAPLVDPLCTILYDMLRPAIIQLSSLDQLCELIAILQHEVGLPVTGSGLPRLLNQACSLCLLSRQQHRVSHHASCSLLPGQGRVGDTCLRCLGHACLSSILRPCTCCVSITAWLLSSS